MWTHMDAEMEGEGGREQEVDLDTEFFNSFEQDKFCLMQNEEQLKLNMAVVFGELLPNILCQMTNRQLLRKARLVCRAWRDDATLILLQRKSLKTSFEFCTQNNEFLLVKQKSLRKKNPYISGGGSLKTLRELTTMLTPCKFTQREVHHFPSCWFRLDAENLEHHDSQAFFQIYGQRIKKLTIDIRRALAAADGHFKRKIFQWTPNLETLKFFDGNFTPGGDDIHDWPEWAPMTIDHHKEQPLTFGGQGQGQGQNQNSGQDGQVELPRLTSLEFGTGIRHVYKFYAVLKQLAPIAPKLSNISVTQGFNSSRLDNFLPLLTAATNMRISHMKLDLFDNLLCPIENLEKIALAGLRMDTLTLGANHCPAQLLLRNSNINDNNNNNNNNNNSSGGGLDYDYLVRTRNALWRILENTNDRLTKIYCSAKSFYFLTRIPMTAGFFPHLKSLFISCHNFRQQTFDVGIFSPKNVYKNYGMKLEFPSETLWTNLTEVAPCMSQVGIDLFNRVCDSWFPFLDQSSKINPSVTELNVCEMNKPELLRKLTNCFPNLKSLNISSSLEFPAISYLSVETGGGATEWNRDQCSLEVLLCSIFDMKIQDENPKKENPLTILNLKELSDLTLSFETCGAGGGAPLRKMNKKKKSCTGRNQCSLTKMVGIKNYEFDPLKNSYVEISTASRFYFEFESKLSSSSVTGDSKVCTPFAPRLKVCVYCQEHRERGRKS